MFETVAPETIERGRIDRDIDNSRLAARQGSLHRVTDLADTFSDNSVGKVTDTISHDTVADV